MDTACCDEAQCLVVRLHICIQHVCFCGVSSHAILSSKRCYEYVKKLEINDTNTILLNQSASKNVYHASEFDRQWRIFQSLMNSRHHSLHRRGTNINYERSHFLNQNVWKQSTFSWSTINSWIEIDKLRWSDFNKYHKTRLQVLIFWATKIKGNMGKPASTL